jgi:hypothetical protein
MAARLTAYLVALIVSVTFIAGLIVGAQRSDDGPVDLIVVNGSVYTADGDQTMAEAVAVQGNKILLVGSNRDVQRLRRPQTVVVDAKGGAVVPGFNDAQVNFLESGLALQQVDLEDADTLAAIESSIRAWAAMNPDSDWVVGRGWTDEAFDDAAPTRKMLDALVPDRPAMMLAADGETAWVNSAALKLAKITHRTTNPPDGIVVKDASTGEPTGVLKDEAVALVTKLIPAPTREERLAALRTAIDAAHRRGVTSVQELSATPDDLEVYDTLRRATELTVRVYAALRGHADLTDEELDQFDTLRARYTDDPVFKTGAISLVVGAESDDVRELVSELDGRGWQVILQAIGDGAARVAHEAVEYASGRAAAGQKERRHRVAVAPNEFEEPVQTVQLAIGERRSVQQAVDAFTRDAAWASFDEHRKGSIERDMLADLVILTHDIFAVSPARLAEAEVAVTIFDGKVVYTRPTDSND